MGLVVDKHLKLDKPFMSVLQSTQPRLIKVMDSVSNSYRADVKALENAKTGKVTAVVMVQLCYTYWDPLCTALRGSHYLEDSIN
jgi:hypothetical protein